ncbi:hypothetical protein [Streptomyces sp. NPDC056169]
MRRSRDFDRGQVLDIEEIVNEAEIPFDGTFSMQATLLQDNVWAVSPR